MSAEGGDEEEGPPRRRKLKKRQAQGLRHMTKVLLATLAFQASFLANFLVKPLFQEGKAIVTEVAEVFGVKSYHLRLDLVQVFGGHANITEVAASRGLRCGQVVDELYGFDLRNPAQRAWLDGYLHTTRPRLVTVEFPCGRDFQEPACS